MAALNKYKLWCDNDNQWEYVWQDADLPAPSACPSDPVGHTVDNTKTSIVDSTVGDSVEINNFATETGINGEFILRSIPQVTLPGFIMCDRDIKLCCGEFETSASYEDFKWNPITKQREDWGEMTFHGCFKLSGTDMVSCSSQQDVDDNATLSIWDYQAKHNGSPTTIEIRGGGLAIDNDLTVLSGDPDSVWDHQLYITMAPDIPAPSGGGIAFFDGYLKPFEGKLINSINPIARLMEPIPEIGNLNTIIRAAVYYPPGCHNKHVLRLITYRKPGEF